MATDSGVVHGGPASSQVSDKGLKKGAISYVSNIVIGVASTAPAYSLAATLGFIALVSGVGMHAPAVLIVSFVPILLIAVAYKYLNRADPDAGTTFAWTTRAFGPGMGWLNGWAIFLADVLVMASLSDIAAIYTFKLFGFTELGESKAALVVAAIAWIAIMTWICWRGIELSAAIQRALLTFEVIMLGVFAVVALIKVYGGSAPHGAIKPTAEWFNPFAMSFGSLLAGGPARGVHLLGLGFGRGRQRGVRGSGQRARARQPSSPRCCSSSSTCSWRQARRPSTASGSWPTKKTPKTCSTRSAGRCSAAPSAGLAKLLIVCVLTSASASTQTTILPTARTTLSMAHWKAVHKVLGKVHKTFLTPDVSTIAHGLDLDRHHGAAAARLRKRAVGFDHRARLPRLLLLRLHRPGLRRLLPP